MSRDFAGKRIGVIGTGATGIQTITAISRKPSIKSLSVFQRTANCSAPLHNSEITPEQMLEHKGTYEQLFQRCAETPSGFLHAADPRKSLEATAEERQAHWEKLYDGPGFGKWLGVFSDTYTDRRANKMYPDFIASKIRQRVHDPATVETTDSARDVFPWNQKTPTEQVTPTGIKTHDGNHHNLDIVIFATGFDAITGAFNAIEWHAKDGRPLTSTGQDEHDPAIWPGQRPRTFLGLTVPSLPNMFMVLGPHQPFGNATRSIEHAAQVISDLLAFCKDHNITYVELREEAVERWTEHVFKRSEAQVLVNEVESWMTGVNQNVKGKNVKSVVRYSGSAIEYRTWCRECQESGWKDLVLLGEGEEMSGRRRRRRECSKQARL